MSINLPIPAAFTLYAKLWLLSAVLTLLPAVGWSQEYTVTNLGTLGGSTSTAYAVNDNGQVVGSANITGNAHADPFLYSNGVMTNVWKGGTKYGATAVAINDDGHFVVNHNLDTNGDTESYFWDGTLLTDLGTGGATSMNASDMVVGNSIMGRSSLDNYWVYANGKLDRSPGYTHPGAGNAWAWSVNNDGVIAGMCNDGVPLSYSWGCVFGPNVSYDLQNLVAGEFPPIAIRSDNTTCSIDQNNSFAIWSNTGTEMVDFSLDYGVWCNGLDDYGDAVGGYLPTSSESVALIYDPLNGERDLDQLAEHSHSFPLFIVQNAVAISDTGYIAANCQYTWLHHTVEQHACLLTPNPAPILGNNILQLAKVKPHCEICKRDLVPEAKSLPESLERLSLEERNRVRKTVEEIDEHLKAAFDDKQISASQAVLLLHQSEMVLKAIGVGLP